MNGTPWTGPERRLWPRRPKRIRVLVSDPDDALGERFPAYVVDRSRNGLCLVVGNSEIEPGAVLKIRYDKARAGTPWVEVIVRNRRQREGHVELGCEFQEGQSFDSILLLG